MAVTAISRLNNLGIKFFMIASSLNGSINPNRSIAPIAARNWRDQKTAETDEKQVLPDKVPGLYL